jgi:hypothetical protein
MRRILVPLVTLLLLPTLTTAQTFDFGSTYTLYSTGDDATYSGTMQLDAVLPAGIEATHFFDHLKGDKTYTETSLEAHSPSGFFGVYEVQDEAHQKAAHLAGVGYRQSVAGVTLAGKFFPYSTHDATDFAAEVSAHVGAGAWVLQGFVDMARDEMLDDMQFFSKVQAVRQITDYVNFVGEYRWERERDQDNRSIWFGLTLGI